MLTTKRKWSGFFVICLTIMATFILAVQSESIEPFPIGIYWPPSPANTTYSNYQTIKNMNTTFVLMGNGVSDLSLNDAAITQAAANGLKVFVSDARTGWAVTDISQSSTGDGKYVYSNNSLGQSFKVPTGEDCSVQSIQLYIDNTYWTSATTLTLRLYDGIAKTTLLGTSSIQGPVTTYYPIFNFNVAVTPGSTCYWELSSNNANPVGWVCSSTGNAYSDGTGYQQGVALGVDFWFKASCGQRMYSNTTKPTNALIDEIANHYATNSTVAGYNLSDEPFAYQLTRLFDTVERFRYNTPSKSGFVNIFPDYVASPIFGSADGNYVTSTSSLGQSFTTNSVTTAISTMQLYIDRNSWGTGETLTLKIWNSPSKTTLIAQGSLTSQPTSNYPQFTLNASVSANTAYFWELTHNGGGDNAIGWVINSGGNDWERSGNAYINGTSYPNSDFWFTINQNLTCGSYEDYVYRWAKMRPDFLMYDYYPWLITANSIRSSYYSNMEIIRNQSLKAQIPFWTYIQSSGDTGYLRVPNASEMRYQIYTSLAYGCKGYSYFLYWTPSGSSINNGLILSDGTVNTPVYNAARDINAEVLNLGATLNTLTSQNIYHTGALPSGTTELPSSFFFKPSDTSLPVVIGYFTNSSGRKFIMAVNRDIANSRTISFNLYPKPSSMTEISKTTGSEISTNYNSSTGIISGSFAPGEGKLFALPAGY